MFVDDALAGEVNLNNVTRGALQSATIGYWVDQRLAGNGYVAEAVVVVMKYAFEQAQLHRLEICIVPRNTRSRRVMEKLEVREEGIAERYLEIAGTWEDHIRYGMTVEEWIVRQAALSATWSDDSDLTVTFYSPARRNASARAWRTLVRRFHILVFQWRAPLVLFATFCLATSAS